MENYFEAYKFSKEQEASIWRKYFKNNSIGRDILNEEISWRDCIYCLILGQKQKGSPAIANAIPLHKHTHKKIKNKQKVKIGSISFEVKSEWFTNANSFSTTSTISTWHIGFIVDLKNGKKISPTWLSTDISDIM